MSADNNVSRRDFLETTGISVAPSKVKERKKDKDIDNKEK